MNQNDRRIPLPGAAGRQPVSASGDSQLYSGQGSFEDWSVRVLVTTRGTVPFLADFGASAQLAIGGNVADESPQLQSRFREALENDDRVARADVLVAEEAAEDDETNAGARQRRVRMVVRANVDFVTGERQTFNLPL